MIEGAQLPHSDDLEGSLVARLLLDPAQLPVVSGSLLADDFYNPVWRQSYAAMQKISQGQGSVDIVTLQAELGDDVGSLNQRLAEFYGAQRAPLEEYINRMRGLAFRRRMISSLNGLSQRAHEEPDRDRLLSDLHDAVVRISEGYEEGSLVSPSKAAESYRKTLAERAAGVRPGLTWPLQTLDDLLLPAAGGELILVAARPSVGKTVLAEQMADHWAKFARHPILFASLEMSLEQLFDRAMSRATELPSGEIIRGIVTKKASIEILAAIEARQHVNLWYLDDPFATTNAVRAAAAKVRLLTGGLSGIVVDYIQLLKDRQDLPEVGRVTGISRTLKAIAREFNVPMIALSQLNRQPEAREDKRPRLSDLRESGALEQDADRVIALTRKLGEHQATVEVLKARQGGNVGSPRQLWFDGDHVRFVEMAQVLQDIEDAQLEAAAVGNDKATELMQP